MRLFRFTAVLSVFCAFAGMAATKKAPAKAASSQKAPAASKKAPAASKSRAAAKGGAKAVAKAKAPAVTWRNRQQSPTADRFREIQQALVAKGYLKSEPSGVWDADSIAAMQHFQADQKLNPSGKINAASLIGLGLGAKSAGAPEAPPLPGAPVTQPGQPNSTPAAP